MSLNGDGSRLDSSGVCFSSWFYKINVNDDPGFYGTYEIWLNFKDIIPPGLLPFADNSGGSQYLIDTRPGTSGQIYFWRLGYGTLPPSFDNIAYVADSFEEFLLAIRAEED